MLERIGAGLVVLFAGAGPVVGPALKRWALRSKAAAAVDDAQVAEAAVLEKSWSSLRDMQQYMDAKFQRMSEERDHQNTSLLGQVKTLQEQVTSLEAEIARLSSIERHAQDLEAQNRVLRERLRVLGEVV
jgi:peptidoglycan hydrolase CwlO-like protein